MRSAVFESFGEPATVLEIKSSPTPNPGPGQVRIKTILSAVHNHDLMTIAGQYGYKPPFPAIAGSEAVGTIDDLGEGVTGVTIGQRVSVAGAHGTWAEFFLADARTIVPVPDTISDESAAQLIGMPLSAIFLLRFVGAQPGQWIAQNAATGAVATALAMAAQAKGINVVNLVRQESAIADLADLGIRNGVSTAGADWKQDVQKVAGGKPIVAGVDGVGGEASGDLMSLLAEKGVLVSFGAMSGKPMQIPQGEIIFREGLIKGFWFTKLFQTAPPEEINAAIGELLGLVSSDVIRLRVDSIFDLEKVAEAISANAAASRRGKVLLRL
ncbi:zinc-binding dehydrogenase [Paraburkholderia sp. DHOC27]|uniref:zinc-binding dehydrogenase n=1 Tax=Paraburkholderia sp. DHOC27 TaxID=2303330 RepID=UPI000E3EA108|nr:zinc-binding dehydrogenase [Paraburkholderia sp. DHOC27]RFU45450.1 alcohol dehydrogenase [Paraburkholderia sp. DHOC27]